MKKVSSFVKQQKPMVDLHTHSTASDGVLTPSELVEAAAEEGVHLLALTDHDTCSGVEEAQRKAEALGMNVLPGIEISCGGEKEIHILGYGVDPNAKGLIDYSEKHHLARIERTDRMIEQLNEAGYAVNRDAVFSKASGNVGRPHVARALLEAGYVHSVDEAFVRFLNPGKCGYVPKENVPVSEGCKMIRDAGGFPVLAHPMLLGYSEMVLSSLVHEWKIQGLCGIEVYHPSTANHRISLLLGIAQQESLLVTGGSDFHGPGVRDVRIGQGIERWTTWQGDIRRFYNFLPQSLPSIF